MARPRIHKDILNKYGRLTAIREVEGTSYSRRVSCVCDCGNKIIVNLNALLSGNTKSCGCLKQELLLESKASHGLSATPLYSVWGSIKDRCLNTNCKSYKNYGGRGISICGQWVDNFHLFYKWAMNAGYKPGLTIERVNNDKSYCPENCTFIPLSKQSKNRRNLNFITFKDRTKTISSWAREIGISRESLRDRFKNGWGIEEALTTPKLNHRRLHHGKQ